MSPLQSQAAPRPAGGPWEASLLGIRLALPYHVVLYNSPLAVCLLGAALVIVATSAVVGNIRLSNSMARSQRLVAGTPLAHAFQTLRRRSHRTILAALGILLFSLLLAVASVHDAFDAPGPAFGTHEVVGWQLASPPPLETFFDRYQVPNSASEREREAR